MSTNVCVQCSHLCYFRIVNVQKVITCDVIIMWSGFRYLSILTRISSSLSTYFNKFVCAIFALSVVILLFTNLYIVVSTRCQSDLNMVWSVLFTGERMFTRRCYGF